MPWSMTNAPPAMRSVPVSVREKAIQAPLSDAPHEAA